ncbi:hypothetical protein Acr_04g0002540 [Actinidia rufa]|uniref:Uncharacterized protein n=1 Tax=Actinidia rufa TaxID=165716 RepID=A0A7J0EH65_9ERIC|nr:hypothetical protein Acr_04g0002540 [Actinidia rufa]
MVAAMGNELVTDDAVEDFSEVQKSHDRVTEEVVLDSKEGELPTGVTDCPLNIPQTSKQVAGAKGVKTFDVTNPIRRCLNQLSRQNKTSMWLLGYIAIISTWPLVGAALHFVFKKKLKSIFPAKFQKA